MPVKVPKHIPIQINHGAQLGVSQLPNMDREYFKDKKKVVWKQAEELVATKFISCNHN